jgi:hypothetical protein
MFFSDSTSTLKTFLTNENFKQVIDSLHCKCLDFEYTGDYNIRIRFDNDNQIEKKIGFKGYICPQSLKDIFYNPLNIYLIKDSLFIESNLNSDNPSYNSAEFGEFIGINPINRDNLKFIEIDSLYNVLIKHVNTSISNYTFPALIQIISSEDTKISEIKNLIECSIRVYYVLYNGISKKAFNKNLEELKKDEVQRVLKIVEDDEIRLNLRLNTFKRVENKAIIPSAPKK